MTAESDLNETLSLDGPPGHVPDGVRFLDKPSTEAVEEETQDLPDLGNLWYTNGHFVLSDTMSGPHRFVPLRWRDRIKRRLKGDGGDCRHCYWPSSTHEDIEGKSVPSRPIGDYRSAREVYVQAEFENTRRDPMGPKMFRDL